MVARNKSNRRKREGREAYLRKVKELGEKMPKGTVAVIEVSHDDNCRIWRDGRCDCSAEVKIGEVLR